MELAEGQEVGLITCVKGEKVQGVLTLLCDGVRQTCHDDRVVELKEQLGIGRRRRRGGRTSKGRRRDRVKENAP